MALFTMVSLCTCVYARARSRKGKFNCEHDVPYSAWNHYVRAIKFKGVYTRGLRIQGWCWHLALAWAGVDGPQKLPEAINHVMLALDAVLYSFLPLFFCMLLRVVQSRELLVHNYIYTYTHICRYIYMRVNKINIVAFPNVKEQFPKPWLMIVYVCFMERLCILANTCAMHIFF